MVKILVAFYSTYGHCYQLAKAVAEGAESAGASVDLKKFPETHNEAVLEKIGAKDAAKQWSDVPDLQASDLENYDGILFGIPTRYGNIPTQIATVLDQTGGLWQNGKLIGKVGSVFTSTASQHGGQETTITGFHTFLIHMGMVVSGVPYAEQNLLQVDEVMGGSPYGAGTITSGDGSRQPSEKELTIARFQGKHVAGIAAKLAK